MGTITAATTPPTTMPMITIIDVYKRQVLNTEKNELFSCEAAGYDTASSGFSTTVPVLGEPAAPLRRYLSDNRIRTERVLRANYLATINDLPKAVEKTADKTMKVIYTLRKGEDA